MSSHYTPHSPLHRGHLFQPNLSRTEPRSSATRHILRDCENIDSSPTRKAPVKFNYKSSDIGNYRNNYVEQENYFAENSKPSIQPNVIGFNISHDEEQNEAELSYSQLPKAVKELQKLVLKLAQNHQKEMRKMQLEIDRQEILIRNLLGNSRKRAA